MKKTGIDHIYSRLVEQAPLALGECEQKQEGTIVLRDRRINGKRLVHQPICGCVLCRRSFPNRAKTTRLLEQSS